MAKRRKKATKKTKAKRRPPLFRRQGSAINPTEAALLGRSVDRATATKLRTAGWTLAKLKAAKDSKLRALGLTHATCHRWYSQRRPLRDSVR
jgi:hypothetical protein